MAYQVEISERAERNLDAIVKYLAENWSEQVKTDFLADLAQRFELIARMPRMYRQSRVWKGVYECVVNKYTIAYYRIRKDVVQIIPIQDSRQDPNTLEL